MNEWKVWKINGPKSLVCTERTAPAIPDKQLRVRVTKVFLSGVDAAIWRGALKADYPIVPGRFAVGMIADESGNELFPKGTRVLLHTFRPRPYTGTEKIDFSEDETVVCGQTQDGFLSDFVYADPCDLTPIPDVLSDERALVAHYIALAKSAVECLGPCKGQNIAVVGANIMGILTAQLLIYQQAAPILIDTDPSRLEFARSCGIYYTLAADEDLLDGVANITGGRLASGAVFIYDAHGNDHKIPFRICGERSTAVYCGFVPDGEAFSLDLALRKQLTLKFVRKVSEFEPAFNLLFTHAVDTEAFRSRLISPDEIVEFFGNYEQHPEHDVSEVNIVSLI